MKYLMINTVCGIRSTGRICADIAESLTAQGNVVKIAYGRETVPEKYQKYAVRIGTDLDVKFHGIQGRLFDNTCFASKAVTKKFIAWVMRYDPDIIHIHNIHGYYINAEVLFDYLRTCGKKIIWTLHDCWPFTGHCPYFEYSDCSKWLTGCGKCPQIKEYPKSYLDFSQRNWQMKKRIFTGIPNMSIVVPSQWLGNLVKRSYMSEYPVYVINNGIDLQNFKPTDRNIKEKYRIIEKNLILGVASEWNYRKGLSYMVELSKKLPDDYVVAVIGVSKDQQMSLPDRMISITRTSDISELAGWYTAADIFVNPTLEDNYPTTNLEAIACGTPVVTFEAGGSPESASLYGMTVPKGNIDEMIKAIYKMSGMQYTKNIDLSDISRDRMVEKYIRYYSGDQYENKENC